MTTLFISDFAPFPKNNKQQFMDKAPLRIMLEHGDEAEAHPAPQIPLWITLKG